MGRNRLYKLKLRSVPSVIKRSTSTVSRELLEAWKKISKLEVEIEKVASVLKQSEFKNSELKNEVLLTKEKLEESEKKNEELVKERNEKEDSVERLNEEVKSQKEVLDMVTEELRNKEQRLKKVAQKKNDIEKAKASRDGEVVELSKLVQRDVIFNVRKSFNEVEEKNAMLTSEVSQYKDTIEHVKYERIKAQKALAEQKKKVEELKLVISERKKKLSIKEKNLGATVIQVDNKSAIELAKNPVNHERSKHIDVRFHFIREHVKEGSVELVHVASRDQAADIFTKPLPKVLFDKCKKMIGMKNGRSI